MLALCSMFLVTYYAFNYAGIIGLGLYTTILIVGNNVDFNSAMQTVTITSGSNSSTINIAVINDDIVEEDETFTMKLNVPASLGPGIVPGVITMATANIIDTSSRLHHTL